MITGKTKILGILGYPVSHTLSPVMHNEAFRASGLDYCYLPFKVAPERLLDAVGGIRALNIRGVNITVPHKERIIPLLDHLDKEASLIGAVNTVVNKDGKLYGYNTDAKGFIKSLKEEGIMPGRKKVMILGAGGAARAVAFSLLLNGVKSIQIYNRTPEKAETIVDFLNRVKSGIAKTAYAITPLKDIDILINATSLGLKKNDPLPIAPAFLCPGLIVYDLIYNPQKTGLLIEASRQGLKTISGLGMLLWQGVLSFRLWTGIEPPVEIMRKAIYRALRIR